MKKIAIVDVDGHSGFPNLALMKISAWHKQQGHLVEWHNPLFSGHVDKAYMSKVFTFSPDYPYAVDADEVIRGGTGYGDMTLLPEEMDDMRPDYTIYPRCNHAIGFLTRGCIRKCPWCIVPKKEGTIKPYRRWEEVKRDDSREMVLLDNNILACDWGIEQIERMAGEDVRIDFNQGMDARLITREVAGKLSRLKWIRYLRISCDTDTMIPVVEQAVAYLGEAGVKPYRIFVYVLVEDIGSALRRVEALRALQVNPFAQPYIDFDGKKKTTKEQRDFARWVNHKAVFKTTTWERYKR